MRGSRASAGKIDLGEKFPHQVCRKIHLLAGAEKVPNAFELEKFNVPATPTHQQSVWINYNWPLIKIRPKDVYIL